MDEKRIGDLLVEAGIISRDDLERVLKSKAHVGERRVLSELYAMGLANERQLAEVLARRLGSPVAVLSECVVDLEVVKLVPVDVIKTHQALPIAADERSVTVVTPDLDAPGLFVPLGFATGRRVVPLLGIHAVLEHYVEESLKALVLGEKVLVGPKAEGRTPYVAVAKWAPALGLAEANALAKEIADALTLEDPTETRIGVIRLKQMVIERDAPFVAEERSRVMQDDGAGSAWPSMHVSRSSDDQPAVVEEAVEGSVDGTAEGEAVQGSMEAAGNMAPPTAEPALVLDAVEVPDDEPADVPAAAPVEAPAEVRGADRKPSALVVDDDAGIRTLIAKALRFDGIEVAEAQNGEEATTMLRTLRPNVIVLDAMLPVVHGFEICASLKRSQLRSIPIIMISAVYRGWEQARDIQEVHGADHFVEKPFEVTFLRRLVADVLKLPSADLPRADENAANISALKKLYDDLVTRKLFFSADAIVEQWIALDPFDGRAWLERGHICAQAGDLVGAMAAYEAAAVYGPSLLVGHLALATVYERLGFIRRARATWLRARASDSEARARIDKHLAGLGLATA